MTQTLNGTHLRLDGHSLRIADVVRIARSTVDDSTVELDPAAAVVMDSTVRRKDDLVAQDLPVYGLTTGFGDSCTRQVAATRAVALQRHLILYHLNGVGPQTPADVARATVLIRANCLSRGPSAVRPELVRALLHLLDRQITPVIPERGSLGASGDLVPLSYLAAALLGEGEVEHRGVRRPAREALALEGLTPVELAAKEGLALINGTSFGAAFATVAASDAAELAWVADLATALTCEVLLGNTSHFAEFIHASKGHPGQCRSAATIRELLAGSVLTTTYAEILARRDRLDGRDHLILEQRIQDKYSVRCAPHVNGVLRDTLDWVGPWLEREINSSNDNPLFDPATGELHHGGNFYAGHVGQAADALKVAVANLADLLDRQLALVVDEKFNAGLPANLVDPTLADRGEANLHHGFKGMQIACSSVTAEALKLAAPATVFSRSTEAHNQDKVSMATTAAREARTVVELTQQVAAIHLLALAQALDLRGAHDAGPAVRRAHALIRERVPFLDRDRRMDHDIHAVVDLIRTGALRAAVTGHIAPPEIGVPASYTQTREE
ncbi:aromatic amino acid ammonia-lyase [Micromonospora sp. NBC_01699]|uniref:aromatic amino acid ammonia-lyase n=1 Tax=Micromonospora sp. NBC_01699 TaxID=2975984 RepID=UPI002E35D083|nr:aromatic amino acid ammonia-lyase [Micromonospora sp. NBC_01699]